MMVRNSLLAALVLVLVGGSSPSVDAQPAQKPFEVVEATIADIQEAIKGKRLTATDLVNTYLARIKAYNGACVDQPQGILGPVFPKANAGNINALITLNLRPAARARWGFDERK